MGAQTWSFFKKKNGVKKLLHPLTYCWADKLRGPPYISTACPCAHLHHQMHVLSNHPCIEPPWCFATSWGSSWWRPPSAKAESSTASGRSKTVHEWPRKWWANDGPTLLLYKYVQIILPYLTFWTFLDPFLHLEWGSVTTLIPPDQSPTLQMNDETTQTGPSWPIVDPSPPSSCPVSSRNAATAP